MASNSPLHSSAPADMQAMQQIVDATVLALLDLAELLKPKDGPERVAFQARLQDTLARLDPAEEYRRAILKEIADM